MRIPLFGVDEEHWSQICTSKVLDGPSIKPRRTHTLGA